MWLTHNMYKFGCIHVIFCVGLAVSADETVDSAKGWNANIEWVTLEEAESLSKAKNQPVMLLIHKSWCGACRALRPKFAASTEIEELSKEFVMVNAHDDEEPADAKYAPDGSYIPRILFIDQNGRVLHNIYNRNGSDQYKYYYHDTQHIVSSMRQCLQVTRRGAPKVNEL